MVAKRPKELIEQAAKELGISVMDAVIAYKTYWMFIRETIESFPLDGITEEEFNKLRSSVNIPGLGKFSTSYKRIQRIDKANKIIDERAKSKIRQTTA